MTIQVIILLILLPIVAVISYFARAQIGRLQLNSAESKSHRIVKDAIKEAETTRKELLIDAKDQLLKEKNILEKEIREQRQEIQSSEKKLNLKEESIESGFEKLKKREKVIEIRDQESEDREREVRSEFERHKKELERISGMTADEAKRLLLKNLENEIKFESTKIINKVEEEAHRTAEKKAKDIIITAIQRNASDYTAETTITTVSLPSEELI
jgi:ribonucrease Y